MPSSSDDRAGRRLLRSVAVVAAVAGALLAPGTAVADEPAGRTVVGELVQAWAETGDHGRTAAAAPAPVSWVETADGGTVPVESGDVADLPPGATVAVTLGDEQGGNDAEAHSVLDAEVLRTPVPEPAPSGPVTNQVTVAMVAPAGTPDGARPPAQQIVDLVNGPVADFWAEQTGGAVTLGVTASHDWITTAAGCAEPARLWNEVAAAVGFVPGAGQHLLVYVPPTAPGCAYALAEVGSAPSSGGRLYVSDAISSVIAHEIGHNFGLAHSSGRQCDGTVDAGECRTVGYRDYYDVMGASWDRTGALNVVQAAYLGVLPDAQVQRVTVQGAPTTVTLAPLSGGEGVRALRLTDASGVNYWLEFRTATGRDAWLGTPANRFGLDAGVLLRRTDRFPDTSVLLDGSPSRSAGWDADLQTALAVGSPVSVSGGQFTIVLQDVTDDGAVLQVVPSAPPASAGSPAPGPAATDRGTGAVLPADGQDPATAQPPAQPAEGPGPAAAAVPAPDLAAPAGRPMVGQPVPAAATDSTGGSSGGLLLTGAAVALTGAATLVVRRLRRPARR